MRLIGTVVAVPVAVALTPLSADRPMAWNSPTVIGVLPQLVLMGVLMRGIYLSMRRMERSAHRDAVLARAGHAGRHRAPLVGPCCPHTPKP